MAADATVGPEGAAAAPADSAPPALNIYDPSLKIPMPQWRPLKAFAYDPSRGRRLGNCMSVSIRYEKLSPGPIGDRFAVVDYDGAQKTYYAPVDLDDPAILIQGGLDPSEVDPRFHQQMVYAVASETLERFEAALGRRVHWRHAIDADGRQITGRKDRLLLHPHALREANAFYSPDVHGILFGYFRASMTDPGQNLPGQTVFTCLSHDIVAHETTHAIVDGIRTYFMEPTNIDVAAFHEAFADLAALFRHFSHRETLIDTLQKTGGRLYALHLQSASAVAPDGDPADRKKSGAQIQADIAEANPLIGLANQFGEASGMHGSLRSALGTPPNSTDILTVTEPHSRGSILVAAVFDAYFSVYLARATPLLRIYRSGGRHSDDVPTALAELLAAEASRTAEMFFTVCARSLDYCPPVDITFGDFLRALITADRDFYPNDTDGVRDALMQAFRLRGIVAEDAAYFSEGSLCWPEIEAGLLPVPGLQFGDPNGLTRDEQDHDGDLLRKWAKDHAHILGFDEEPDIEVPSFHPMFRVGQDGSLKVEMVVELIQTRADEAMSSAGPVPLRSGVTLIVARPPSEGRKRHDPYVRYAIAKRLDAPREQRLRTTLAASEIARQGPDGRITIDFCLIHGGA
ncbi:MAG: hypothetical protein QOH81_714 [Sphingomonadales bacterium]|jgi:hypothetical protein|nr:hypothetical protein [Sphingomonadales bacterium]